MPNEIDLEELKAAIEQKERENELTALQEKAKALGIDLASLRKTPPKPEQAKAGSPEAQPQGDKMAEAILLLGKNLEKLSQPAEVESKKKGTPVQG